MWKTIWRLWRSESLLGRPDRGLFRGVLRFLRSPRVCLGMLVILVISLRECLSPWINPKALLRFFGVHCTMERTYLNCYQGIEAPFIMVVAVTWVRILVVGRKFEIVRELSVTACRSVYYHFCKLNTVFLIQGVLFRLLVSLLLLTTN